MPITSSALPALPVGTDTRSMTERVNAIIKNLYNKLLPVGAASTVLTSDGTTFSWAALPAGAITNTGATTFLGSDVPITTGNVGNGPNTGSFGAAGWVVLLLGTGLFLDTSGVVNNGELAFHDGTNYLADTPSNIIASGRAAIAISAVVTLSAATTFTLRAKAISGGLTLLTTGNASLIANKATSITAVRLA